jgi:F-type H+-transporting ATPase subunit beta
MSTATATPTTTGRVVQVIGPVVDIEFPGGQLPAIYNAVRITGKSGNDTLDIVVEVEQHLGENRVRTVAMKPTDGLQRGMTAADLGGPSVAGGSRHARPRAERARQAVDFPIVGEAIARWPIHRPAPARKQSTSSRCSRPASRF